jgi:anti-sigma-K factor RskA
MLSGWSIAGIAAVLFAVGFSVGSLLLNHGVSTEQRYNQLVASAVSRGDRVVAMQPAESALAAIHLVLARSKTGQTFLIVGPTSAPAHGKVYQLWFIRDHQSPVSAGVFSPSPNSAVTVKLARSLSGYQVSAMTVEPGPSGSPQPTTTPFATAQLVGHLY